MNRVSMSLRLKAAVAALGAIAISLPFSTAAFAGDPFRSGNQRNIGSQTEAAFNAFFKEGNYPKAKDYVLQAEGSEASEPMVYAMRSAIAYNEGDLQTVQSYAAQTIATAEKLSSADPLRSRLYTAVGRLLEGAYKFQTEGPLPAVNKMQEVFKALDEAEKIDPADPELNLVKGYIDLLVAVYLPFSDTAEAIKRLDSSAQPAYLAYRGIAVAYRDLNQYGKALDYAERAFTQTPNNPDIQYLKAQMLYKKGEQNKDLAALKSAKQLFNQALEKRQQLPKQTVAQIVFEVCQTQERIDNQSRDCTAKYNEVRNMAGSWGPEKLPPLD